MSCASSLPGCQALIVGAPFVAVPLTGGRVLPMPACIGVLVGASQKIGFPPLESCTGAAGATTRVAFPCFARRNMLSLVRVCDQCFSFR